MLKEKNIRSFDRMLVEEGGFEPPKRNATDLQSAPFGHSGTPPYELGAGRRIRTPDLLITNQLLYRLSYTSASEVLPNSKWYSTKTICSCQAYFQKTLPPSKLFLRPGRRSGFVIKIRRNLYASPTYHAPPTAAGHAGGSSPLVLFPVQGRAVPLGSVFSAAWPPHLRQLLIPA